MDRGSFVLSDEEQEMLARVSEYHATCEDDNEMRSLSDGELGQLLDIVDRAVRTLAPRLDACEVCGDCLMPEPPRCEKHAHTEPGDDDWPEEETP